MSDQSQAEFDCTQLSGRMRSICEGTSGLSEEKRQAYLRVWSGQPPNVSLACIHRGKQVSTIGCTACGGKSVQVKVFACKLLEECTLMSTIEGLPWCGNCLLREET